MIIVPETKTKARLPFSSERNIIYLSRTFALLEFVKVPLRFSTSEMSIKVRKPWKILSQQCWDTKPCDLVTWIILSKRYPHPNLQNLRLLPHITKGLADMIKRGMLRWGIILDCLIGPLMKSQRNLQEALRESSCYGCRYKCLQRCKEGVMSQGMQAPSRT